jgi:hypothetical protein
VRASSVPSCASLSKRATSTETRLGSSHTTRLSLPMTSAPTPFLS